MVNFKGSCGSLPYQRKLLEEFYQKLTSLASLEPWVDEDIYIKEVSISADLSIQDVTQWLENRRARGFCKGRATLSIEQVRILEWIFQNYSNYVTGPFKKRVATELGMSFSQVGKWYEARRQRGPPSNLSKYPVENPKDWERTVTQLQLIIQQYPSPKRRKASLYSDSDVGTSAFGQEDFPSLPQTPQRLVQYPQPPTSAQYSVPSADSPSELSSGLSLHSLSLNCPNSPPGLGPRFFSVTHERDPPRSLFPTRAQSEMKGQKNYIRSFSLNPPVPDNSCVQQHPPWCACAQIEENPFAYFLEQHGIYNPNSKYNPLIQDPNFSPEFNSDKRALPSIHSSESPSENSLLLPSSSIKTENGTPDDALNDTGIYQPSRFHDLHSQMLQFQQHCPSRVSSHSQQQPPLPPQAVPLQKGHFPSCSPVSSTSFSQSQASSSLKHAVSLLDSNSDDFFFSPDYFSHQPSVLPKISKVDPHPKAHPSHYLFQNTTQPAKSSPDLSLTCSSSRFFPP